MEREATEKVNGIKRIDQKKEKGQGMTATLQAKVKIKQEAIIGRVPYKGKKKSGLVKKTMHQAEQVAYKNKQANHI